MRYFKAFLVSILLIVAFITTGAFTKNLRHNIQGNNYMNNHAVSQTRIQKLFSLLFDKNTLNNNHDSTYRTDLKTNKRKHRRELKLSNTDELPNKDRSIADSVKEYVRKLKENKKYDEDKIAIIEKESFIPLNDLLENYTLNSYNKLYSNTLDKFITNINYVNEFSDLQNAHRQEVILIKDLYQLKEEIDNAKYNGDKLSNDLWPRHSFLQFTIKENAILKNSYNYVEILEYYKSVKVEQYKELKKEVEILSQKFESLILESVRYYRELSGKELFNLPINCNDIREYFKDTDILTGKNLGNNNYFYMICKGVETIKGLNRFNAKVTSKIRKLRGRHVNSYRVTSETPDLSYPEFKLYLYVAQHLYALNVIKFRFDDLDTTNPLEI